MRLLEGMNSETDEGGKAKDEGDVGWKLIKKFMNHRMSYLLNGR